MLWHWWPIISHLERETNLLHKLCPCAEFRSKSPFHTKKTKLTKKKSFLLKDFIFICRQVKEQWELLFLLGDYFEVMSLKVDIRSRWTWPLWNALLKSLFLPPIIFFSGESDKINEDLSLIDHTVYCVQYTGKPWHLSKMKSLNIYRGLFLFYYKFTIWNMLSMPQVFEQSMFLFLFLLEKVMSVSSSGEAK